MAVFNKELIINGEAVRSPEQQVYKNMKDIEVLKEKIKDAYKTSEALTSSSVSVAISDTNAPDGTTEGWLMTSDGLLFSITGGDETNLLLSYYADLKGPQGEDGAAVNIDDSAVSPTKTWSSQKIYLETAIGNDKGIFYTTVAPVLSSGTTYDFDLDDVANATSTKKPKIKDLVIYIYNGVPLQVYEVLNDNSSVESLKLVGTYSQGSKSYQHNLHFSITGGGGTVYFDCQVTNNIATPYTLSTFKDLCYNNRIMGKQNSSLTTAYKEGYTSYSYGESTKTYNIYTGGFFSTGHTVLCDLSTATDSNSTIEDEVVAL